MSNFTKDYHSKFHSINAFCGNAGPEEIRHLRELLEKLTNKELKLLTKRVGIEFLANKNKPTRDDYISVLDEADREDFYREYRRIIKERKTHKTR